MFQFEGADHPVELAVELQIPTVLRAGRGVRTGAMRTAIGASRPRIALRFQTLVDAEKLAGRDMDFPDSMEEG